MTVYVYSDTHFDHNNIRKYCDRPFDSGCEMNQQMIKYWNSVVSKEDTVIFGGDLSITGSAKRAVELDEQLNGHIILLKGNRSEEPRGQAPRLLIPTGYFSVFPRIPHRNTPSQPYPKPSKRLATARHPLASA